MCPIFGKLNYQEVRSGCGFLSPSAIPGGRWVFGTVAPAFLDPEGGYTMHACVECTLLMQEMSRG